MISYGTYDLGPWVGSWWFMVVVDSFEDGGELRTRQS